MALKPSLRVQWILALSVAAIVVVALVLFVDHSDQTANEPDPPINHRVVVQENREAETLISEDQAPHLAALATGLAPAAALTATVKAYMLHQINLGTIAGPVEHASCAAAPGGTASRLVFRCTVEASSVNYPFDGVVAPASRQVTYCKRDYAPVWSMNIPVSSRCT